MSKKRIKSSNINWKLLVIISSAFLLMIMFLIPTILVIPFQGNETTANSVETAANPTAPAQTTTQTLESPFHVNVLRTESNEVEQVPLEDYVVHVVASEMPADFELEALKAQALAARTYIVRYLMQETIKELPGEADVTDTVQHQVFKNNEELRQIWGSDYHWKMDKITEAVVATQGEIITYNKEPITPAFFSTSNGYTENAENYWTNELPYLKTVESPWDEELSPKFRDQIILTASEVEQKLKVNLSNNVQDFQITRTASNRVKTATIADKTFTGREVREMLNLPSNDFTITRKDDHFVFTTKGYGHGVGMSQYGANGMALEGKNYQDIITYYYKGTTIETLEQAAPTLLVQSNS
ncbi:stage II sporulation protein D [Gracilibacillus ureilyticus]|uniref:Stage II sporulation protein D n=1 Tax=Gracilibacillus ureilyticus TaxID=531814 RepID=A0A1H9UNT5_9BACI|nr:stage II sporulation protein D [Gracilibacillus ureilyticus]SES10864.1 stage II sporulation protein D [Gracilibacillus ureilyticus]